MEATIADDKFLEGWTLLCPISHPKERISEYVEGRRKLPDDSPMPGPYHVAVTPYAREIMDAMAPQSPIQHGVMMCAAQVVKTTILENICAYYMDELPSPILFVSGTEDGAEKWASTRLEPMIDSIPGLRDKIGPVYNQTKSKKTGDKVFEKLFIGGSLHIVSAQSPAGLASMSKRILLRDEIDRAPANLRSGEGNWLSVSEARTKAWRYRKKIFDSSTPGDMEVSEINRLYEMGDCRMYFVPCPHCHHEQVLEMGDGKEKGLRQITTPRGKEVVYVCCSCRKEIPEYQKEWMLANGHWQPTRAGYDNPAFASWHINALYSPLGLYSWKSVWEKWEVAKDDPSQMKAFINLELGLPYQEQGTRPDDKVMLEHRGRYRQGELQRGTLYLTAGVDVQAGKESWQEGQNPDEGPRLEMEVLAHGRGYRTWSLCYRKFYGAVGDPYAGAWLALYEWCRTADPEIHKAEQTGFVRETDKWHFPIWAMFIDSGFNASVVYTFCSLAEVFMPCKGIGWVTEEKLKLKGDMPGPANTRHFRIAKVPGSEKEIFEVSTNYYKDQFYSRLHILRAQTGDNPPGYCDFPMEYPPSHYEQLNSETRWRDGSFHEARTRREALDCRVYAMCAGEAFLMDQVSKRREAIRRQGKEQGASDAQTEAAMRQITPQSLLELWDAQTWPK